MTPLAALACAAASCAPSSPVQSALPPASAASCPAPTIRQVEIVRHDVFESSEASSWIYRLANDLHIDTRPEVIRRELLFAPGDPLVAEALEQTERNLRAQPFLSEVAIDVFDVVAAVEGTDAGAPAAGNVDVAPAAGRVDIAPAGEGCATEVDVVVTTRDAWSTSLETRLNKVGDRWVWTLGVSESNLLGRGKRLEVARRSDIDRDSTEFIYQDPRLGGSRTALLAEYADQSDGRRGRLEIGRPYFALDNPRAWGAGIRSFDQRAPLYEAGEEVDALRHVRRWQQVQYSQAVSRRPDSALRLHAGYRRQYDDVEVEVRDYGIVELGVSAVQHRYFQQSHVNHERVEDVNLGREAYATVGVSTGALGGTPESVWFFRAGHHQGFRLGPGRWTLTGIDWASRYQDGRLDNSLADARLGFFQRTGRRQVLVVSGRLRYGTRLDPEVQITLGADSGLRGYPVRQLVGDRSLLLSAEHRWFLADDVLKLVSLGVAAFVDSGYAWPEKQPIRLADLHTNVGISLLIGRTRLPTDRAVARIDLAYALDRIDGHGRWLLSFGTGGGILF